MLLLALCAFLCPAQLNKELGGGAEGIRDWSRSNVYVDMVKHSRGFVRTEVNEPARLDANGWPLEDAWTIVLTVGNDGGQYNGTYKLTFKGQADVDTSWSIGGVVRNKVYNAATDTTTADIDFAYPNDAQDGYFVLRFRNTVNGVKNIRLIRPGYPADTTQLFTDQYKNHAKRFNVIRFMDFTETNGSLVSKWADRTPPTWPSVATRTGVPWEHCFQLCQELGRDAWINVPLLADDDYVRRLAELAKVKLSSSRKLYVEYSNEIWNGGFQQFHQNLQLAIDEVAAGNSDLAFPGELDKDADGNYVNRYTFCFRRMAKRLYQINRIFASVYGEDAMNNRVRIVYGTQVVNPALFRMGMEWMYSKGYEAKDYFYAVAGAPYFNMGDSDSRTDLTKDQVLAALSGSVDEWGTEFRGGARVLEELRGLTGALGLKFVSYEGGPDTFGPNNIAAKKAASLDPAFQAINERYLKNWYEMGGDLFLWFVIGATNYDTPYGTWGLTNDMRNQTAPKILAMDNTLAVAKPAATLGQMIPATLDARRIAGARASFATDDPFLRYLEVGNRYNYIFRAPAAGTYAFRVIYSGGGRNAELLTTINGFSAKRFRFKPTAVDAFEPSDWAFVKLNKGQNYLGIEVNSRRAYAIQGFEFKTAASVMTSMPSNLAATAPSTRRIDLRWDPPYAIDPDSYNVYRSATSITAGATPFKTGLRFPSFVDRDVVNGQRYYYRVTAVRNGVETTMSNQVVIYAVSPNLMRNPGYETGNLAGWLGGGSTMEVTTATPRSGTYAMRFLGQWNSVYQPFENLKPGAAYTLKVYAKSDLTTARVLVRFRRPDGTEDSIPVAISGNAYKLYTIRFTVPENLRDVLTQIEETSGRTGTVFADDWSLTED